MSVSGVSSGMSAFMAYWRSQMQRGRQDFKSLSDALKAGDLTAAQQAFGDMQQVVPGFGDSSSVASETPKAAADPAAAKSTTPPEDPREVIKSDVEALGSALKSGDLAGAQTAFSKLQQDMQTLRGGDVRRHHHGHEHAGHGAQGVTKRAPAGGAISTTPPSTTAASAVKQDADGDNDGTTTFFGVDLKA